MELRVHEGSIGVWESRTIIIIGANCFFKRTMYTMDCVYGSLCYHFVPMILKVDDVERELDETEDAWDTFTRGHVEPTP